MKRKTRKGWSYPITPDWQEWVRTRMKEMIKSGEATSQNDIARQAGIAKATLSEALEDGAVETKCMPEIHKALGWPAPLVAPPVYVLQLIEAFSQLSEFEQGRFVEQLRQAVEKARR
jgi:hypothetical protein